MVMMMLMIVLVVVMMVVMMMMLFLAVRGLHLRFQLFHKGVLSLDHLEDLGAADLIPRGGDHRRAGIEFPDHLYTLIKLLRFRALRAAQDHSRGALDLIVEELAKRLHLFRGLQSVDHGDQGVQVNLRMVFLHSLHRSHHVGELAHARRLDQDAVRMIGGENLLQTAAEITHQRAADAARIELSDLNAGIL